MQGVVRWSFYGKLETFLMSGKHIPYAVCGAFILHVIYNQNVIYVPESATLLRTLQLIMDSLFDRGSTSVAQSGVTPDPIKTHSF